MGWGIHVNAAAGDRKLTLFEVGEFLPEVKMVP
jgi:hypothetical protein